MTWIEEPRDEASPDHFRMACSLADVPTDEAIGVTVGGIDVAVGRNGDEVFAVQDLCSHAAVALSEGEVEVIDGECTVECWLHGSRFDMRSGKPTGLPATEPIATFPAEVRDTPDGKAVFVDTTTTLNGVRPT